MSNNVDNDINQKSSTSSLEETLSHAKVGYENAQATIRFIDTKTGVLTGLTTLIVGLLLSFIKWYIDLENTERGIIVRNFGEAALILLAVIIAIAAITCVLCCVRSVAARNSHTKRNTVLFPCLDPTEFDKGCEYLQKVITGMSTQEIATEYHDQLINTGIIIHKKIRWHRIAVKAFGTQIIAVTLLIGTVALYSIIHSCIRVQEEKRFVECNTSTCAVPSCISYIQQPPQLDHAAKNPKQTTIP